MHLKPDEKQQVGAVASSHRKIAIARPPSFSDGYVVQSKAIIDRMANIPHVFSALGVLFQNIPTGFRVLPNQTLRDALFEKIESELSKFKKENQKICLESLQEHLSQDLIDIIEKGLMVKNKKYNTAHDPLAKHPFMRRMELWQKTKEKTSNGINSNRKGFYRFSTVTEIDNSNEKKDDKSE